jgi:DNA-binding transcriptional MerR regulator
MNEELCGDESKIKTLRFYEKKEVFFTSRKSFRRFDDDSYTHTFFVETDGTTY